MHPLIIRLLLIAIASFFSSRALAQEPNSFYYSGDEQLKLDGSWTFYWEAFIDPSDSVYGKGADVELPQFWKKHPQFDPPLPSFGFASYRTIIISDDDYKIGLEYYGPHNAQKIYLNGELIVETGIVAETKEKQVPLWLPGTVYTNLKEGENELIIHVANYRHVNGGIYGAPIIGPAKVMAKIRQNQILTESFVIGAVIVLGSFFIGLFLLWRRNLSFLYYGLFALSFSIWYGNYGLHLMKTVIDMSWGVSIRLTYISMYSFFAFMSLYVFNEYPTKTNKTALRVFVGIFVLFIASTILLPSEIFTKLVTLGHMSGFLCSFYALVLGARGVINKKRGSLLVLLAIGFFIAAMASVAGMHYDFFERSAQLTGILYLISFSFFVLVLAQKIETAFTSVYHLQLEAKNQRDEIEKQANELSRMDQFKSRFFANISHDFRSPLTLIKGYLNVIKSEDNILSKKSEKGLEKAEKNVDQLVMLTDEIRDLISLESENFKLNLEEININTFLKTSVGMFNSLAENKNINLDFRSKIDSKRSVCLDPYQIEKVIYNLLSNALKFTERDGAINVNLEERENIISFSISDTGKGISKQDLPFIFDRYFQSNTNEYRSQEGLGIGLAFVKEIIGRHEGSIRVESELRKGTTFIVEIPATLNQVSISKKDKRSYIVERMEVLPDLDKKEENVQEVDFSSKEVDKSNTILVVDDHPEVREYIMSVIPENYYILSASNGEEALAILKKQQVDLLISDLMMPIMDGFELIETIRKESTFSNTRIMVVSARTSEEDLERVLDSGVNDFITKPFDARVFEKRIHNALQTSQQNVYQDTAVEKGIHTSIEKDTFKKLNELILKQIDNPKLGVHQMAELLITSERNANRVVKKLTGLPPKSFIKKVRFDYAEVLIKEGRVSSVSEAGRAIGMQNTTEFARQFTREKGIAPADLFPKT